MAKREGQVCDRCGGDIGNGDITQAATTSYLSETGDVANLKTCLARCAARTITARSYPARARSSEGLARPGKARR